MKVVQSMATSAAVKFRVQMLEPGAVSVQLLSGEPYSRSRDGGRVPGRVAEGSADVLVFGLSGVRVRSSEVALLIDEDA